MRKDCKFVLFEDCEGAFQKLKKSLTSVANLSLSSKGVGYKVLSDASKNSLGCVLMQQGKVVAYGLRQLRCMRGITRPMIWS